MNKGTETWRPEGMGSWLAFSPALPLMSNPG